MFSNSEEDKIDILINNAGVICHPQESTSDGNEYHFQVNYLGIHFNYCLSPGGQDLNIQLEISKSIRSRKTYSVVPQNLLTMPCTIRFCKSRKLVSAGWGYWVPHGKFVCELSTPI